MILVVVFLILALFLGVHVKRWGVEGSSEVIALVCRVLSVRMPWASLVHEFFELLLHSARLLALRGAVKIHNSFVWLALSRRARIILLAFDVAMVVAPFVVVVVAALRQSIALLLLLIFPCRHHIMQYCNCLGSVPAKISEESRVGDAVMEIVNDVLLRDIGDGCAGVEEATSV